MSQTHAAVSNACWEAGLCCLMQLRSRMPVSAEDPTWARVHVSESHVMEAAKLAPQRLCLRVAWTQAWRGGCLRAWKNACCKRDKAPDIGTVEQWSVFAPLVVGGGAERRANTRPTERGGVQQARGKEKGAALSVRSGEHRGSCMYRHQRATNTTAGAERCLATSGTPHKHPRHPAGAIQR